jgi:hypothetical protein
MRASQLPQSLCSTPPPTVQPDIVFSWDSLCGVAQKAAGPLPAQFAESSTCWSASPPATKRRVSGVMRVPRRPHSPVPILLHRANRRVDPNNCCITRPRDGIDCAAVIRPTGVQFQPSNPCWCELPVVAAIGTNSSSGVIQRSLRSVDSEEAGEYGNESGLDIGRRPAVVCPAGTDSQTPVKAGPAIDRRGRRWRRFDGHISCESGRSDQCDGGESSCQLRHAESTMRPRRGLLPLQHSEFEFHPRACPLRVKSRHGALKFQCPLYPRKRTSFGTVAMSALCQKATSTGLVNHLGASGNSPSSAHSGSVAQNAWAREMNARLSGNGFFRASVVPVRRSNWQNELERRATFVVRRRRKFAAMILNDHSADR